MRDSVARAISRWIVGSSNYACINIPSFNVELFPSINLYFNLRCIMQGGARLKLEKGKSSFCTRLVGRKCRYDSFSQENSYRCKLEPRLNARLRLLLNIQPLLLEII